MSLQKHKRILFISAALLLIAVCLFCVWFTIHSVKMQFVQHTKDALALEEQKLITLAELTSKERVDATVDAIISDCTVENRARFDEQLSMLPMLRGVQLSEIEQLFNMCGDFYAQKKAIMVSRLQSQFEFFSTLAVLISRIDTRVTAETYNISLWNQFIVLQTKQSELSLALVDIQGAIILQLKKSADVRSDVLQALMVDGQKTRDALSSVSAEIENIQKQLPKS